MGIRNTKEQSRTYTAAIRARRKESGIVRVEVYVHREDAEAIKAAAREALRARGLA